MLSEYFDIDSLLSLVKQAGLFSGFDEHMVGAMNGFLNMLFSIGKSIVLAGNYLLEKILSVDILNKTIDSVFHSGNTIWDNLFRLFGSFFVMLVLVYGIRDMFRYGMEKIFVRLLIFSGLFIVGTGFYTSGSNILKEMNSISTNAQEKMVTLMAPNISDPADQMIRDLGLTEPSTPSAQIENMMYYRFVVQPVALFNFGTTNLDTKKFLDFSAKNGEYTEKKENDIDTKVKEQSEKNPYLTGKKLGEKWAVLVNCGIDYVLVAGVILFIAVMNFLVQIFLLLLVLLSPIFLIRALLPDNEYVMFNYGKLIFSSFAFKIILGLGFGLIFMVLSWLETAFGASTFIGVIASLVVKVLLAIIVVKNFHWFKSIIAQGKVNGLPIKGGITKKNQKENGRTEVNVPGSTPKEITPSMKLAQGKNEYADNIALQAADDLEAHSPNHLQAFAHKMGYMNERGLAGTVKDGVVDKYQESKLGQVVDRVKGYRPKEAVNDRVSELTNAFLAGQFEAFDRNGLVNSPDTPVDSVRMEEVENDIRATESDEEPTNHKREVKEAQFKRTSSLSSATESFEERLAKLRGEPLYYSTKFHENRPKPEPWATNYNVSSGEELRQDDQVKDELRPKQKKKDSE